jgi:hypothetical protein
MTNKLCKDCKWCEEDAGDMKETFSKCKCPKGLNTITGFEKYARFTYCDILRKNGYLMSIFFGTCGKYGKWFEPKNNAAGLT